MGCDIHLYAEKKIYSYTDKEKKSGVWVSLDIWQERDEWKTESEPYQCLEVPYKKGFYTNGRNYNLFTALAGVRSGSFFGEPKIISEPKGFPDDASKTLKLAREDYGSDGHSDSYLTLRELKEFDYSSYGETCKAFLEEVLPKLENAKRDYDHQKPEYWRTDDDVRIVFWFDN